MLKQINFARTLCLIYLRYSHPSMIWRHGMAFSDSVITGKQPDSEKRIHYSFLEVHYERNSPSIPIIGHGENNLLIYSPGSRFAFHAAFTPDVSAWLNHFVSDPSNRPFGISIRVVFNGVFFPETRNTRHRSERGRGYFSRGHSTPGGDCYDLFGDVDSLDHYFTYVLARQ